MAAVSVQVDRGRGVRRRGRMRMTARLAAELFLLAVRITDDGLAVDLGKLVNGFLSFALPQTLEGLPLEIIVGSAIRAPRKWIIAVLTNLDAGSAIAA